MRKDRGRHPKKARKVTQKLGARPKQYRHDPDRHIIAFARAMEMVWECTQDAAFDVAVSWFYCDGAKHDATGVVGKKNHRRQPSGTVAIGWHNRPGAGASSLHSEADNLIVKSREWWGGGRRGESRRLSAEDVWHLQTLIAACCIALKPPNGQAIHHLLDILGSIGEREFGEKRLAPLVLRKSSPQQLFSQI
jgi:hypothetical protein